MSQRLLGKCATTNKSRNSEESRTMHVQRYLDRPSAYEMGLANI